MQPMLPTAETTALLIINTILFSMMDNEQLVQALIQLAQKIANTDQEHPLLLSKELLLNVDLPEFKSLFDRFGYRNFHSLQQVLETYYLKKRSEKIKWDCDLLFSFEDQFVKIAVFIFDLALSTKKEDYIQGILSLPERLQRALQPFVQRVTLRQQFTENATLQEQPQNRQKWIELTEQYDKVRHEKEHWLRKYEQLKENYDYLKSNHDKIAEELNYLRQERYSFINELGGNECGSVEETIQKIKLQLENYEKSVEKIQKQLQEKKAALKKKEEELNEVVQNYKATNFEGQTKELEATKKRLAELEEELNLSRTRQHELSAQLEGCREYIKNKQQQCMRLERSVASLEAYGSKYQTIRKLHNHFKSKIVKEMKELNQ